jgi:hypothetical protein
VIGNSLNELDWNHASEAEGTLVFSARGRFEVDEIRYDPDFVSHTTHPIVDVRWAEHDCTLDDLSPCSFDWGTESREHSGGDAYRWHPGMVYYRSTEFDTPPKGGAR